MAERIPQGITRAHILAAIEDLKRGVPHAFGRSVFYDVLYQNQRYPPKAAVGLAAGKLTGTPLGPHDFKGGLKTICFRVLRENGFEIIVKADYLPFPEEIDSEEEYVEGAVSQILVNRFERDPKARALSIRRHGAKCLVCGFDFEASFGPIGAGFIHVHHIVQLAEIRSTYVVDPVNDLKPVCPNCHAMLHRRTPPYSIDELRALLLRAG
jgi:5-methylcytosine-specific restriction protein A